MMQFISLSINSSRQHNYSQSVWFYGLCSPAHGDLGLLLFSLLEACVAVSMATLTSPAEFCSVGQFCNIVFITERSLCWCFTNWNCKCDIISIVWTSLKASSKGSTELFSSSRCGTSGLRRYYCNSSSNNLFHSRDVTIFMWLKYFRDSTKSCMNPWIWGKAKWYQLLYRVLSRIVQVTCAITS